MVGWFIVWNTVNRQLFALAGIGSKTVLRLDIFWSLNSFPFLYNGAY